MTAFDGLEKSRWLRAEGAGVEKRCEVLFGVSIIDGTVGGLLCLDFRFFIVVGVGAALGVRGRFHRPLVSFILPTMIILPSL